MPMWKMNFKYPTEGVWILMNFYILELKFLIFFHFATPDFVTFWSCFYSVTHGYFFPPFQIRRSNHNPLNILHVLEICIFCVCACAYFQTFGIQDEFNRQCILRTRDELIGGGSGVVDQQMSDGKSGSRKLKGESVVVAILPLCMEVSYCTSGFFIAKPAKQFYKREWPFPCVYLKYTPIYRIWCGESHGNNIVCI